MSRGGVPSRILIAYLFAELAWGGDESIASVDELFLIVQKLFFVFISAYPNLSRFVQLQKLLFTKICKGFASSLFFTAFLYMSSLKL